LYLSVFILTQKSVPLRGYATGGDAASLFVILESMPPRGGGTNNL
jgi:hypothetical protein